MNLRSAATGIALSTLLVGTASAQCSWSKSSCGDKADEQTASIQLASQ